MTEIGEAGLGAATGGYRMPDWLGLGGKRSGTNWLIANLHEHPNIFAVTKQVNFFHKDESYDQGLEWYCDHWKDARSDQIVGECSAAYLYSEKALRRIARDCPNAKLLIGVRNPVLRTRSEIRNAILRGELPADTSLREAIRRLPEALDESRYYKYISRYLDLFDRQNVCISVMDFENPEGFDAEGTLKNVYRFLEVDDSFPSPFVSRMIGHGYVPKSIFLENTILTAAKWIRNLGKGRIHWWIKSSGLPALVRHWNDRTEKTATAHLTKEDVGFLLDELRQDILDLQKLVDVDLEQIWIRRLRG